MKPVFQSIIDPGRGDCISACFASLLELSIDQVPSFVADAYDRNRPHESWDDIQAWCASRGFTLLRLQPDDLRDWRNLEGQYAILSVPSQRFADKTHAVVGQWCASTVYDGALELRIMHDPSPLNEPYASDTQPLAISFLVPKSPSRST